MGNFPANAPKCGDREVLTICPTPKQKQKTKKPTKQTKNKNKQKTKKTPKYTQTGANQMKLTVGFLFEVAQAPQLTTDM